MLFGVTQLQLSSVFVLEWFFEGNVVRKETLNMTGSVEVGPLRLHFYLRLEARYGQFRTC